MTGLLTKKAKAGCPAFCHEEAWLAGGYCYVV